MWIREEPIFLDFLILLQNIFSRALRGRAPRHTIPRPKTKPRLIPSASTEEIWAALHPRYEIWVSKSMSKLPTGQVLKSARMCVLGKLLLLKKDNVHSKNAQNDIYARHSPIQIKLHLTHTIIPSNATIPNAIIPAKPESCVHSQIIK